MGTATSGTVSLHELIRGLKGWKSLRTSEFYQIGVSSIIDVSFFVSWEAEEIGLFFTG